MRISPAGSRVSTPYCSLYPLARSHIPSTCENVSNRINRVSGLRLKKKSTPFSRDRAISFRASANSCRIGEYARHGGSACNKGLPLRNSRLMATCSDGGNNGMIPCPTMVCNPDLAVFNCASRQALSHLPLAIRCDNRPLPSQLIVRFPGVPVNRTLTFRCRAAR